MQTLRYYERRHLLPVPPRSNSGYRSFSTEDVRVVRFVKHAQELGFTLGDIGILLRLAVGGRGSCRVVGGLAREKLAELDRKIAMLTSMRRSLYRLVQTCDRPDQKRECPLLLALEKAAAS